MRYITNLLLFVTVPFIGMAQVTNDSDLFKDLQQMDMLLFGESFNNCNIDVMRTLVTDDLEFYHDKNGISKGKELFVTSFQKNMCGGSQKIRRELVAGSLEVFPLYSNGVLYGALQKGIHEFFITPVDKPEFKDGIAKFSHLWLKEDGTWKLSRALSYDHKPPSQDLVTVTLTEEVLSLYVGNYSAPMSGEAVISLSKGMLHLKAGKMETDLKPISEVEFSHPQAPLTFEFVKNATGSIEKFIVKENGVAVEEAIRQK